MKDPLYLGSKLLKLFIYSLLPICCILLVLVVVFGGTTIHTQKTTYSDVWYSSPEGSKPLTEKQLEVLNCTYKSIKLYGRVQFVESFADFKIQIVESFPDLRVQLVHSFPDNCGEWEIVESFPDFKVQVVESFPDLKVQYVESFPGQP